jgi:ArsR family transcriptional regulator, arsenate/arsenite/antimonite-responsive transcriptional repressor
VEHDEAVEYAAWFRCLADATRLRVLHTVAVAPDALTIGELVTAVGVGQSSVSGHVRRLERSGFVTVERRGTASLVRVDPDCLAALPEAARAIMGRAPAAAVRGDGRPRGLRASPADRAAHRG